jgi:hypothetical protein
MKAVLPENEAVRLAALYQYAILDTEPEQRLDDITRLAAQICGTPIALVSLVDANRQWFKSKVGLSVEETEREIAFCSHTILLNQGLLIVPNALADERFATNPLVISTPNIRFYAGAPLVTPEGLSIGSLCVIDYVARNLNSEQIVALQVLSRNVISLLELKRKSTALTASTSEYQRSQAALKKASAENLMLTQVVASVSEGVLITDPNQPHNPIVYTNPAFSRMTGYQPEEVIGKNGRFLQGIENAQALAPANEDIDTEQPKARLVNYRKDGQPFWNETKISPVFSQQGQLQYFVGVQTDISDRVLTEAGLRWQETLLRSMTSVSPLAFYVVDHTDAIVYFNQRFCAIWGIEHLEEQMQRKELNNQDIISHCLRLIADVPAFTSSCALQSESDRCVVEDEIGLVDGRTIRRFSTQVRDDLDHYFGRLYLFEDITTRKSAEKAIRESEERFRTMADTAPVMIWMAGTDKLCNYFNQGRLEFTGRKLEQELGNRWVEGVHPDDMQVCLDTYSTAFDARETFKMEYRLRRFDGEYRWILDTGNPRFNCNGSFAGYIGSCIDITEGKQAQEKIREQAALLDVTTDAILVRDLNHQILFWNSGAERLYGYGADEAIASNAIDLLGNAQIEEAIKTATLVGEWSGELNKVTKQGKQITVESRWTLMRDRQGQPKSILCVDTDITEKKQLETQFLRAQRLESIGTLASGIAHDLNNVLAPILISAQLLQLKTSDQRSVQLAKTIENNAKRGAALIKQVLSFARGVEGKHTTLQLGHLVTELKQIANQTFPKSISVYTDVIRDLWTVSGDATQLHQVLMNLVVNARDAMPNGGTLKITAENLFIDTHYARTHLEAKVGSYIVITVTDTGVGMPPEIVERIFEPFFTTKELGKGTGLGLSIVMGIVKGHGGFVNVYSQLGRGTKFQVYLPAVETLEKQRSPQFELPPGQGELILLVDDENAIRETTKTSLETFNYRVLTAKDGIEAIALYVQHRTQISLVLVNLVMPSMDGFTTIRTLQKLNSQVKIIATSGLVSNAQSAATTRFGVKTFLSKPYTTEELLKSIHELLKTK